MFSSRVALYSRAQLLTYTLESGIDVGQGITVWPGKFSKRINVGPGVIVGH